MLGGRADDAPARSSQGGFRDAGEAPSRGGSSQSRSQPAQQVEDSFTDDDIPF